MPCRVLYHARCLEMAVRLWKQAGDDVMVACIMKGGAPGANSTPRFLGVDG